MLRRTFLAAPALVPFAAHAGMLDGGALGLEPDSGRDESATLQAALNRSDAERRPLLLRRGAYVVSNIELPVNVELHGHGARLVYRGAGAFVTGGGCERVRITGVDFDAGKLRMLLPMDGALALSDCGDIAIRDCAFSDTAGVGLSLVACGGQVSDCLFHYIGGPAALFSRDATGLVIRDNIVRDAADGGILVHRSAAGADGTIVTGNRIERVRADSGGTGPYGNGINTYRAHDVKITDNHVSDCAFSAIRCHSASNATITGNTALRSGETALYSEFDFQGAVIANNVVDGAAVGISIANFDVGGRLAVCADNVVRNCLDRGPYPAQNAGFGHGIFVEADTAVTGNVVDGVARWGIALGWGPYLRDVAVTGNVVRDAGVGVAVSVAQGAGPALIANNRLAARDGGIVGHAWLEPRTGELVGARDVPPHLTLSGNRV